jgi:N-acetylglucosaminylphosphatidylinositol deacetylase
MVSTSITSRSFLSERRQDGKLIVNAVGNADGLGEIRKQELVASALILGLRSAADVLVIEDAAFPDGMNITWEASNIAACLSAALPQATAKQGTRKQVSERSRQKDAPTAAIDVLITFDRNGISGHSNHISLYHGARFWLEELMKGKGGWECPVSLYTLSTTNIARKYISVLDAPLTIIQCVLTTVRNGGSRANNMPRRLMYLNDLIQYRTAQKAMTQAHKSQMLWFRWGWILTGRYMVVNDLRREKTT